METAAFDFHLPPSQIAQTPAPGRSESKLLVYERGSGSIQHTYFHQLPNLLPRDLVIFRNSVAVLPARLNGRRQTGGAMECLLLQPTDHPQRWICLLKPGRRLTPGTTFLLPGDASATVISRMDDGQSVVHFDLPTSHPDVEAYAHSFGKLPLPPYIERRNSPSSVAELDRARYQTVYADPTACRAVAAPTAGLHFTDEIFEALAKKNIPIHNLILEVGIGTFRPIQTERIEDHRMHSEAYRIPPAAQQDLHHPANRSRLAIGTTSLRAIEDYMRKSPQPSDETFRDAANIFIYPPNTFRGVDAMLTNFHLPRSTLLCLVAAFLAPGSTDGIKLLHNLYQEAIQQNYRFFSYGDAMLIL